ncbi:MAG TPA: thioredoxin domain-containing protein [Actinomycetaceae bacterium]|nr:thioredoxin domain-containing protein [Actinomycetaceae bacterium]
MNSTAEAWEAKYRRSRTVNIVLGVIAAFLAVVVAAQLMTGPDSSSSEAAEGQSTSGDAEMDFVRRDAEDPMAIGDVDAPIVMTYFFDTRCPFCAVFHRDTLPTLIEEYVDAGDLRIEFHDVVFYGDQSADAAVAARAAAEQGMFTQYLSAVYDAAPENGHPDMPRDKLIGFAEEVGIPDLEQFTTDLEDPDLLAEVEASAQQAQQAGVTAVPFFVIGQTAVSGAQPVDSFRQFIDQSLTERE